MPHYGLDSHNMGAVMPCVYGLHTRLTHHIMVLNNRENNQYARILCSDSRKVLYYCVFVLYLIHNRHWKMIMHLSSTKRNNLTYFNSILNLNLTVASTSTTVTWFLCFTPPGGDILVRLVATRWGSHLVIFLIQGGEYRNYLTYHSRAAMSPAWFQYISLSGNGVAQIQVNR